QVYITSVPSAQPFSITDLPEMMALSGPALALAVSLTVIIVESVVLHLLLYAVTIYLVVCKGVATGFGISLSVNETAGAQTYLLISVPVLCNCTWFPSQISASLPATIVGVISKTTWVESVFTHPFPLVTFT